MKRALYHSGHNLQVMHGKHVQKEKQMIIEYVIELWLKRKCQMMKLIRLRYRIDKDRVKRGRMKSLSTLNTIAGLAENQSLTYLA